jgi:uncharacterized membrane protein
MAYQAGDGSIHDSEDAARQRNTENANIARTGNPYGISPDDVSGGIKALIVLPYYLSKLCCSLFQIFFRLPSEKVGKVIQSVIMGALAYVVIFIVISLVMPIFPEEMSDILFTILTSVSSLFFIGPAAWYYLKHYNVARTIWEGNDGFKSFQSLVLISFCICFYGLIIAGIAGLMAPLAGAIIALVVATVAVLVYLKRVKPFLEYATANPGKSE